MGKFFSAEFEPVRRWLYGIALAALALAGVFQWVTADQQLAIAAFVGAVLLIPVAEIVRTQTKANAAVAAGVNKDTGKLETGPAAPGLKPGLPADVTAAGPSPYEAP